MRALLLALSLVAAAIPGSAAPTTTSLRFPDGSAIQAEVVDTPASRERGLMRRRALAKDYGMLFVFPAAMDLSFWMKDTFVPLDMVFIGPDKTITRVHHDVPASTPRTPDAKVARRGGFGQYVLELPAGAAQRRRLAAGQALDFDVPIPRR